MDGLIYGVNPMGWATCKWLRYLWPGCLRSRLNGLAFRRWDRPQLPGEDWAVVRTLLGGLCGSDLALLAQKQPANSLLQAYSTLPAPMGHENVAVVDQVGSGLEETWLGKRVCVEPTLCCAVRGIDPPCGRCGQGQYGACENFGRNGLGTAKLPPGTSLGYCAAVGGSFSEYFLAHKSQLVPVPPPLSDRQAILTDPMACSVHAMLRADLSEAKHVLVYGAGMLGLGVIASLRAAGYTGAIHALDRAGYLQPLTESLGADLFLSLPASRAERFEQIAALTGGYVRRARFGNVMLSGGYDVIFDCVGSQSSINECLKWTRSAGQVILVGTGHGGRLDITPVWFSELTVRGAYGRQIERFDGRQIGTYNLVHEWMLAGKLPVEKLLTHTYRLADYRKAFEVAMNKGLHQAVKVALDFRTAQV